MGVVDVAAVLDERANEVLGLAAAGTDKDRIARLDLGHRLAGGLHQAAITLFPVKCIHRNLLPEAKTKQ